MEQGAGKSERRAEQCGRAGKWSRRWAAGRQRRCRGAGRSARDSFPLLTSFGHLDTTDPHIPSIVDSLVKALKTPLEQVQSQCRNVFHLLFLDAAMACRSLVQRTPQFAQRHSAVYGLDKKKWYEPHQGVMFSFETLLVQLIDYSQMATTNELFSLVHSLHIRCILGILCGVICK
jgi:hypothetical protein